MSAEIETHPKYSVIASIVTMVLCVLFIITSCSTFISAREASQQKMPPTAVQNDITATEAKEQNDQSPAFDKAMDDWEKSRATYLRILDYAQIEQQENVNNKYKLKSNLVESRYHIKNAEAAMFVEQDIHKALVELRAAKLRFNKAIKMADADKLKEMEAIKSNLDNLLENAKSSVVQDGTSSQAARYHQVEVNIENLLTSL